jgi:hypothetical protein
MDLKKIDKKKVIIGVAVIVGSIIAYKVVSKQIKKAKINKSQKEVSGTDFAPSVGNKDEPTAYQRYLCKSKGGFFAMQHKDLCEKVKNSKVL